MQYEPISEIIDRLQSEGEHTVLGSDMFALINRALNAEGYQAVVVEIEKIGAPLIYFTIDKL